MSVKEDIILGAMSKTYAIAELRGRLDLLEMAVANIAYHPELAATIVTPIRRQGQSSTAGGH
jgi:hypothetical protein